MNTGVPGDTRPYFITPHQLVIAEKPSVARSIAAVLGATRQQKGYLEGDHTLVSWCVGHLVELAAPSAYDAKYTQWRADDLPIVPMPWQYCITESTKPQYNVLCSLMNDPRVTDIICATDAGREGELIFRLVYHLCECKKPVQRLWISSMEETAIQEGFQALQPSETYDNLYHAALCRAQADWLVGINATRLFSTMYHQKLNIGRVMTPTLAMLVSRETQITAFQTAPFYHVLLNCGPFTAMGDRLPSRAEAERIAALCKGREARVTRIEQKSRSEKPPKLHDLTSLQRDANRLLHYTAQQTLDYAQSLYEKKLITYPRTDSHYLTSHMADRVQALVDSVATALPFSFPALTALHITQVIDDSKVSDHHALIPTSSVNESTLAALPVGERSILTLLITRLLCAVGDACRSDATNVTLECEGVLFVAQGQTVVEMGWKAIETAYLATLRVTSPEDTPVVVALPPLNDQMTFLPVSTSVKEGKTSPPKHFSEDTLLSAMETAGAADMPEDAERKGLGTPATRAGIIEKLIKTGQVERKRLQKHDFLIPTHKGISLIAVLPEALQSPKLTCEWEHQLACIERGEGSPATFMQGISALVRKLISTSHPVPQGSTLFPDDRKSIGVCPRCGSTVLEGLKGFTCSNHDCHFALWRDNPFFTSKKKELTAPIAAALLKEGRVRVKGLYSPKTSNLYDATVVLEDVGDPYVHFKLEFTEQ